MYKNMANKSQMKRLEIPFFEGINTLVGDNISKKQELKHAENARSIKIGFLEKRKGYRRLGNSLTYPTNYGMAYFDDSNSVSNGFYRVTRVSSVTSIYYLNTSSAWTPLTGGGTALSAANSFFAKAEGNLFMVNGTDVNRYVRSDGTTVTTSATATGHLYNSPIANKIAYYKERLYLGDYKIGTTRYRTGVMMSSNPLGIVSLVDGDHASAVTTVNVTDTKYIYSSDTLQVYRGGSLITSLTVTAKTEYSLTVSATSVALKSSDELWVNGTYSGARLFRWANNPQSGVDVKQYDTFKLSGSGDDQITVMETIGDVLLIANKNNIGIWNDYSFKTLDLGLGCVSERGYVKTLGMLFFIDYTGIYATSGDTPRLMSSKIDEYISGATKAGLEAASMGRNGKSIFCHIGNVTLYKDNGSVKKVLSGVVIEYNLQQENWFIHTGLNVTQFERYIASDNPDRLEFSDSTTGHIYEFLNSTYDDAVTTDKEIPFIVTTSGITLCRSFDNYAYPKTILLEVKRGHGIKCDISLDDGDFFPLEGEAKEGVTRFPVTKRSQNDSEVKCRTISISIREMSGSPIKISRLAIDYLETADVDFDNELI